MTREHEAWISLRKRIDYLNTFAGNRSRNRNITDLIKESWNKSKGENMNNSIWFKIRSSCIFKYGEGKNPCSLSDNKSGLCLIDKCPKCKTGINEKSNS